MSIVSTANRCVGCGACVDVCPTKAIHLIKNTDGFYIADKNISQCVDCGRCSRICPELSQKKEIRKAKSFYGWSLDSSIRAESTSGGVFSELAKVVLKMGGIVYGARYASDFKSVVMESSAVCSMEQLRKSKYCQSQTNGLYTKIEKDLAEGKTVMLVGTPCQITAAANFFPNRGDQLILVDFICGGLMPETALTDYVNYMEHKFQSHVKDLNMRSKAKGWDQPHSEIVFENERHYISLYKYDIYAHYYYSKIMKNEPCLSCQFTSHAAADITIADFWGYRKEKIKSDNKGMSLICVFSEVGETLLDKAKPYMKMISLNDKQAAYAFHPQKPTKSQLVERDAFMKLVRQKGSFIKAAKKHDFQFGRVGVLAKIVLRRIKKH